MAAEETRRRPASAGALGGRVWGLPADQSYLGKPIDPDVVERVRTTLEKYPGTRSMDEREKIIATKVAQSRAIDKGVSAEYWAWTHSVKENGSAIFKLPSDPRKGMPTQEEYIRERVEKGLQDMRKTNREYKQWVKSLKAKMEAEKFEELEAKMAADAAFNDGALVRDEERRQRDADMKRGKREQETQFWREHQGMKDRVAKRPNSAPPGRSSGVESATSMAQRKKSEMVRIQKTMSAEYYEWLHEISVPKFQLPTSFVDYEMRNRKAMEQKERVKNERKVQKTYFKEVQQMERTHHARIMGMVEERLEGDRRFNEEHEAATEGLAVQRQEARKMRNEVAAQSRQELKNMYKRMKEKPLMLEVAYNK